MYEIRKYVHKRQEGEDERISYDSLQPTHLQHTHTQSDSTHTNTHTRAGARAQISQIYNKQMLRWQQNR